MIGFQPKNGYLVLVLGHASMKSAVQLNIAPYHNKHQYVYKRTDAHTHVRKHTHTHTTHTHTHTQHTLHKQTSTHTHNFTNKPHTDRHTHTHTHTHTHKVCSYIYIYSLHHITHCFPPSFAFVPPKKKKITIIF